MKASSSFCFWKESVKELLEYHRMENREMMNADKTDELVRKVITMSEKEQEQLLLMVGRIWSAVGIVILPSTLEN